MKIIREYIDFERGKDPKKAMGLGKFYENWREDHTNKPIVKVVWFLTNPSGGEKRFFVHLMYEANWEGYSDSIWWGPPELRDGWSSPGFGGPGAANSLENMQNKPTNFFHGDDDERSMWEEPNYFNKIIDLLSEGKAKKTILELMEEWFEGNFDTMLRNWFDTGVMTVHKVEYKAL